MADEPINAPTLEIDLETARFLLEVLDTGGLAVPLGSTEKIRLALKTRESLEAYVKTLTPTLDKLLAHGVVKGARAPNGG